MARAAWMEKMSMTSAIKAAATSKDDVLIDSELDTVGGTRQDGSAFALVFGLYGLRRAGRACKNLE
jgi:hypothetical protein